MQATHEKPLRHTIDYRADQFTLSRFEIHSNTCHERKPDKVPANFRLQPICQKDAPYHDQNTEQHPFHVKSSWIPPIQRSVALETYLEEVKIKLAELHWLNLKIICHPARNELSRSLLTTKKLFSKKKIKAQQPSLRTEKTKLLRDRYNWMI